MLIICIVNCHAEHVQAESTLKQLSCKLIYIITGIFVSRRPPMCKVECPHPVRYSPLCVYASARPITHGKAHVNHIRVW